MSAFRFTKNTLKNHTAILGMTGSGKTSTAKLLVEQVAEEKARVCILDPIKSDWWGLISSRSGKRAGLPFTILGGEYGHLPLNPKSGKIVGELVASGKLPLSIIDMSEFGMGDHQEFFIHFSESLFKKNKGVLYLVMEEAHEFAPKEKSNVSNESMAIYWTKKLATGARTKGIRLVVVTHRVQSLHNSILGSCRTLVAQQLQYPADQEPVIKWLRGNLSSDQVEQIASSLPYLEPGEGWIRSTADKTLERVKFPRIKTYDNTATPDSDDEQQVITAKIDKDKLRDLIGAAVSEEEANKPETLKKKIAELARERDTWKKKAETPQVTTVEKEVFKTDQKTLERAFGLGVICGRGAGYDDAIKTAQDIFTKTATTLAQAVKKSESLANNADAAKKDYEALKSGSPVSLPVNTIPNGKAVTTPRSTAPLPLPSSKASGDGSFSTPENKILRALLFYRSIGIDMAKREMVAGVSGYSPTSGGFNNLLGKLSKKDAITYPATGYVQLKSIPDGLESPTWDEARDIFLGIMSNPQTKIINALRAGELSRNELAEATGYSVTSGGFNNLLGKLRSLSVIDYTPDRKVHLTDWAIHLLQGA